MDVIQVILLAVVQGLTEFLPVSSSAHLILISILTKGEDQGLPFVVALHLGTLCAVVFYFRLELRNMVKDWCASCITRKQTPHSRLMWALGWSTLPVCLVGIFLPDNVSAHLREPVMIAISMIIFAVFLGFADHYARQTRTEYDLNWKDILFIGCAQIMALIPGASRSGTTITAGLILGLTREASARYSFLLSIPVILLAGAYEAMKMTSSDWAAIQPGLFLLGMLIAALTAFLCIHVFLKLITRISLMPFVIYRLFLGGLLLFLFW